MRPDLRPAGALRHARDTIESRGLDGAILGHVGDGNYHAVFPVDADDEADQERAEAVNEIVDYALERGGTCTGEHGIGMGKTGHLQKNTAASLPFMREIKEDRRPQRHYEPGQGLQQRKYRLSILDGTGGSLNLDVAVELASRRGKAPRPW